MIKKSFIIIVVILYVSCKAAPKNTNYCNDFKLGTYKYTHEGFQGVIVNRYRDQQVETIGNEMHYIYNIEWISECSYNLILQRIQYNSYESNSGKNDTIYVQITQVLSDSSYHYKSWLNGKIIEGDMIKVR